MRLYVDLIWLQYDRGAYTYSVGDRLSSWEAFLENIIRFKLQTYVFLLITV